MHKTEHDPDKALDAEGTIRLMMADEVHSRVRQDSPLGDFSPEVRVRVMRMVEDQYRHEAERSLIIEARLRRLQKWRQTFSILLLALFALMIVLVTVFSRQVGGMTSTFATVASLLGLVAATYSTFLSGFMAKRASRNRRAGAPRSATGERGQQ